MQANVDFKVTKFFSSRLYFGSRDTMHVWKAWLHEIPFSERVPSMPLCGRKRSYVFENVSARMNTGQFYTYIRIILKYGNFGDSSSTWKNCNIFFCHFVSSLDNVTQIFRLIWWCRPLHPQFPSCEVDCLSYSLKDVMRLTLNLSPMFVSLWHFSTQTGNDVVMVFST